MKFLTLQALRSPVFLGACGSILLFALCFFLVHFCKLAKMGWEGRTPPSPSKKEEKPAPAKPQEPPTRTYYVRVPRYYPNRAQTKNAPRKEERRR